MSIYDLNPDIGLPRDPPEMNPVTDDQVTRQQEAATRAMYNQTDVRALVRKHQPELARVLEIAVNAI